MSRRLDVFVIIIVLINVMYEFTLYKKKIEKNNEKQAAMRECRMQKEDEAIVEEAASRVMCVN